MKMSSFSDIPFFWLMLAFCHLSLQVVAANSGYLIVGPAVFRANTEEVLSVAILKPSALILVEGKLYSKKGELLATTSQEVFGRGTLKLKIPEGVKGRCTLKVCGNCVSPKEGSYTFYNSTYVQVEEKSTSVFIQTDKPVYKPGQKVLINYITVGSDLKPVDQKLLAYLQDPQGTRVIQWNGLGPFCCGIVKTSYQLSSQPPLGTWNVVIEHQGQMYNRSFDVNKYVLPKFEVTIHSPGFLTDLNGCENIHINARYTYGKFVKGRMEVKLQILGTEYYRGIDGLIVTKSGEIRGTARVTVCWSELTAGVALDDHFSGHLDVQAVVTAADGATVSVSDQNCLVSRQLVWIEFSHDTRRYFKPGLPYKGKVLVVYPDGSPADNVTLQLRSDINGKDHAIEEYVAHDGLVRFDIPSLPLTAQSVWISVKVVKIGDKLADEHMLPIYLSITSWYSPSNCHLLIDSQQTEALTVGEEAKFKVYSTCPCNVSMYYEVVSRGNIVHSGIHVARQVMKRSSRSKVRFLSKELGQEEIGRSGSRTWSVPIKFPITHEMAPSSKLIVYYVRPNSEAVADTVLFRVKTEFKNKMSLELLSREVRPGGSASVRIRSESGSCVCIGAVDKSVHLLKPSHRLSTKQVFEELERYDTSLNKVDDQHASLKSLLRKRRSFYGSWMMFAARDSHVAFEEAGLMVMTDSVRMHFQQDFSHQPNLPFGYNQVAELTTSQRTTKQRNDATNHKRTFFPETWIWTCFNSSEISSDVTLNFTAPDAVTSWMFEGLSLSSTDGLAVLDPPVLLTTVKRFFVVLTLPYSVIRNEQARIPVVVHNYLSACVKVEVILSVSPGVTVAASPENQRFCLGSDDTETLDYVFVFALIGQHNISVEARAFLDSSCCVESLTSDVEAALMPLDSDYVQHPVLVEAEGITRYYARSVFFCPREQVYLSTPNKYELQYVQISEEWRNVTFAVRASNDVHLSLSFLPEDNEDMYKIVIGGYLNTHSWISKGKHEEELVIVNSPDILTGDKFRSFWVRWDFNLIKLGFGEAITEGTMILSLRVDHLPIVRYIGFSTGWGSTGDFRLWTKQDVSDSEFGDVLHLSLPNSFVEGSEKATVSVISDLLGPALTGVSQLLRLPSGCGEQVMIRFSPNVYVLRYLRATKQMTPDILDRAVNLLTQGYQTQLTYRRFDGSYSAFGDKDSSGNLWLTAFVLKSFSQAKAFIYVDALEIEKSTSWLLSQQRSDGAFPPVGPLFNKVIQGGNHGVISLTAYVITALLEVDKKFDRATSLMKAQLFLERQLSRLSDPYTTAITSYALTRLKSPFASSAARHLSNMAIKQDGLMFWKNYGLKRERELEPNMTPQQTASSADIETAGYGLLTYVARGDLASALPVVKWLSMQRNSFGGFSSTQDTCVALYALSEYASRVFSGSVNLTVHLASINMDLQETISITDDTSKILKQVEVPTVPTILFVSAEGEGCAMLQVDMSYNVPDPSDKPSFSLIVKITRQDADDSPNQKSEIRQPAEGSEATSEGLGLLFADEDSQEVNKDVAITLQICTRWLHPGSSNMAVLEVSLPSGFAAQSKSIESLVNSGLIKRSEIKGRIVILYFDEIPSMCNTCISLAASRDHLIGLTRPVPVRIYDYYEPIYENSVLYVVDDIVELSQDVCPSGSPCPQRPKSDDSIKAGDFKADLTETCSCRRDCPLVGPAACGSDGAIYHNWCQMEVAACLQQKHLDVVPMNRCHSGEDEISSNEVSEDVTRRGPDSSVRESGLDQLLSVTVSPQLDEDDTIPIGGEGNQTDPGTRENRSSKYLEDSANLEVLKRLNDAETRLFTEAAGGVTEDPEAIEEMPEISRNTADAELPASVYPFQDFTSFSLAYPEYRVRPSAGSSSEEPFSDDLSKTVSHINAEPTDGTSLPLTLATLSVSQTEKYHKSLDRNPDDSVTSKGTVLHDALVNGDSKLKRTGNKDDVDDDDDEYYDVFKIGDENNLDKDKFRQKVSTEHTIFEIVDLDVANSKELPEKDKEIRFQVADEKQDQTNVDNDANRALTAESFHQIRQPTSPALEEVSSLVSSNHDLGIVEPEITDVMTERLVSQEPSERVIAEAYVTVYGTSENENSKDSQPAKFPKHDRTDWNSTSKQPTSVLPMQIREVTGDERQNQSLGTQLQMEVDVENRLDITSSQIYTDNQKINNSSQGHNDYETAFLAESVNSSSTAHAENKHAVSEDSQSSWKDGSDLPGILADELGMTAKPGDSQNLADELVMTAKSGDSQNLADELGMTAKPGGSQNLADELVMTAKPGDSQNLADELGMTAKPGDSQNLADELVMTAKPGDSQNLADELAMTAKPGDSQNLADELAMTAKPGDSQNLADELAMTAKPGDSQSLADKLGMTAKPKGILISAQVNDEAWNVAPEAPEREKEVHGSSSFEPTTHSPKKDGTESALAYKISSSAEKEVTQQVDVTANSKTSEMPDIQFAAEHTEMAKPAGKGNKDNELDSVLSKESSLRTNEISTCAHTFCKNRIRDDEVSLTLTTRESETLATNSMTGNAELNETRAPERGSFVTNQTNDKPQQNFSEMPQHSSELPTGQRQTLDSEWPASQISGSSEEVQPIKGTPKLAAVVMISEDYRPDQRSTNDRNYLTERTLEAAEIADVNPIHSDLTAESSLDTTTEPLDDKNVNRPKETILSWFGKTVTVEAGGEVGHSRSNRVQGALPVSDVGPVENKGEATRSEDTTKQGESLRNPSATDKASSYLTRSGTSDRSRSSTDTSDDK